MEDHSLVRVMRYPNQAFEVRQLHVFMGDQGWTLYNVAVLPGNKEVEIVYMWPTAQGFVHDTHRTIQ